jgi:hypothetical protein
MATMHKYDYLIANVTLPDESAKNCQNDFDRIVRAWRALLSLHLK